MLWRQVKLRHFKLGRDVFCCRSAPTLAGFRIPFCFRCSGLFLGVLIGAVFAARLNISGWRLMELAILSSTLSFPCLVDVLCQRFFSYSSNSRRRFLTGLLLGFAVICFGLLITNSVFVSAKHFFIRR